MTQAVALAQQASTGVSQGFKNRIINGNMAIAQRGTSAVTTDESFPVDRFQLQIVNANLSLVQSSTAPAGFNYSIAATVTSTTSTNANDRSRLFQNIEGFNVADLDWGTANAKTITVSFWARSTVTGTYSGNVTNNGGNRSYVFTYALTANTWTYVTATIPGDTTGTWLKTNGNGLGFNPITFNCGSNYQGTAGSWIAGDARGTSGSTYLATSNSGAVFNITGVQLEVGSTATSFDYRPYGTELSLCYRYYAKVGPSVDGAYPSLGTAGGETSTAAFGFFQAPTPMRSIPTFSANGSIALYNAGFYNVTGFTTAYYTSNTVAININVSGGGLTVGRFYNVLANNDSTAFVQFSSEL
jgi:hypothetical protein